MKASRRSFAFRRPNWQTAVTGFEDRMTVKGVRKDLELSPETTEQEPNQEARFLLLLAG